MRKCLFDCAMRSKTFLSAVGFGLMLSISADGQTLYALQERVAPLWRVDSDFETRLMINNTRSQPRIVHLDVYDASGRLHPIPPLTLAPLESIDINLRESLRGRGGFGQISLRHDGQPLDVAGHVMIMHRRRPLVFDEHFRMRSQLRGNRLVGVSDLGTLPSESLLALSNTCDRSRQIRLRLRLANRSVARSLTIGPRQVRLLAFHEILGKFENGDRGLEPTVLTIEAEHDGNRGEVLVQGLLMDRAGMGGSLRIADHARLVSRRAVSPALRPDPSLEPRLALFNSGTSEVVVTPVLHFKVGDVAQQLALAPISLSVGAARSEEFSAEVGNLPPESRDLGLWLEYEGAPGSVVAELLLTSRENSALIAATPKDPVGEGEQGMTFAWRLSDRDDTTLITLANPSVEHDIECHLVLFFEGGTYTWDGPNILRSGDVIYVDIKRLRDEQIPGQGGVLLPWAASTGQAKVVVRNSPEQAFRVIGQAIQMGSGAVHRGSLGCTLCQPDPSHVTLSPLTFTGNVGSNQQIYPWIHWSDGSSFINTNPYAIDWDLGSTSVANISEAWYNFRVQFQGPGTTTVDAEMPNECHYEYDDYYGECICLYSLPVYTFVAAQVTAKPTVSISGPNWKVPLSAITNDPNIVRTIPISANSNPPSSSGFSWSTTTPSLLSLSASTGNSVTATSIGASGSRGDANVSVTVTINGVTSDSASTYGTVVKPTKLSVFSDTTVATGHTCYNGSVSPSCQQSTFPGNDNYSTYLRTKHYYVLDQFNPAEVIPFNMKLEESYTTPSGSCGAQGVTIGQPTYGGTVTDCFYLCSETCRTGGTCSNNAQQTITVNGYAIFQKTITWSCSGVDVPVP